MKSPSPIIAHENRQASVLAIETTPPLLIRPVWLMNGALMAPNHPSGSCNVRAMGYSDRTLFISQIGLGNGAKHLSSRFDAFVLCHSRQQR
ncbi:hypothetical protein CEXT_715761, partial [Caerostris extrusa]